jgi:hypothetical protein
MQLLIAPDKNLKKGCAGINKLKNNKNKRQKFRKKAQTSG